jgi:CheY-like chemotaxis protein
VESTPGRGACFLAEIKVERTQGSEVQRGKQFRRISGLAEGQPEYRILIVEDQGENWMVLERLLENAGFQVRVAKNGAEGVREFREWRPQFIWMDLRMPVMDGIEATRLIRASEGGRDVTIVAVTASGYASKRTEILAEGMDDYVRKPYRPAEVFECMARHLGVRYREGEASADSEVQQPGALRAEDLSSLPSELRNDLRQAVITLDRARIAAAIDHISAENSELAYGLAFYANSLEYSKIFDAIEAASPPQNAPDAEF